MRTSLLAAIVVSGFAFSCSQGATDETAASADSLSNTDAPRRATVSLAVGGSHTCVLARRGVKCWGRNTSNQATPPALRNPRLIAAGASHTCALDDDGAKCWGSNSSQQTVVPALRNPRQISAGSNHTCALDDDGAKCWGSNTSQQTVVPALRNPRQITAGGTHTCALDDDGVKCWGNNNSQQATVPALRNPRLIGVGTNHSCALDDDGAKCWGSNISQQTVVPAGLRNPRQLTAGTSHTCVVDADGVKCWGGNASGQLTPPAMSPPNELGAGSTHTCALSDDDVKCWGSNVSAQSAVPADVELVGRHACVLANGAVRCIGDNERGQLGAGNDEDHMVSLASAGATDLGQGFSSPSRVAIGRAFGCALSTVASGGAVKCWGYNSHGQLGLGDARDRGIAPGEMGDGLPALQFGSDSPITTLDTGDSHACALSARGEVFCWGRGSAGQLGTESTDDVGITSGPTRPHLKAGLVFRDLTLGRGHTCAVTTDGAVYCFGNNDAGQLGLGSPGSIGDRPGTMGDAMLPVMLGDGFRAKAVASGDRHVCALSEDGRVKCWGAGTNGELGLGDTRDRGASAADLGAALPALDLGHGQVVVGLSCGGRHCCVRTIQNTMKCWGDNSEGQLGYGDLAARGKDANQMGDALPFVMTPPHERVLSIQLDADRTCAKTDSGVRCWGRNRAGELGYGDRQARGGSLTTVPRLLSALGI